MTAVRRGSLESEPLFFCAWRARVAKPGDVVAVTIQCRGLGWGCESSIGTRDDRTPHSLRPACRSQFESDQGNFAPPSRRTPMTATSDYVPVLLTKRGERGALTDLPAASTLYATDRFGGYAPPSPGSRRPGHTPQVGETQHLLDVALNGWPHRRNSPSIPDVRRWREPRSRERFRLLRDYCPTSSLSTLSLDAAALSTQRSVRRRCPQQT